MVTGGIVIQYREYDRHSCRCMLRIQYFVSKSSLPQVLFLIVVLISIRSPPGLSPELAARQRSVPHDSVGLG